MNKEKELAITQFCDERNEALFSLDREKILAFFRKWNGEAEAEAFAATPDVVFWGAIYKAITGITNAPSDLKAQAKKYLNERGWSSYDEE